MPSGVRTALLPAKMIFIAQSRKDLDKKDVLCHPLGPFPWSSAIPEEKRGNTNKAIIARKHKISAPSVKEMPQPSEPITEGMKHMQRLKANLNTFGHVATSALQSALQEGGNSRGTDIVFDVYHEKSFKCRKRCNQREDMDVHLKMITASQILQQWRNILSSSCNKSFPHQLSCS